MNEILEFIKKFQSPSNEVLFKECACYWFSLILHERFDYSSIYYNPDIVHFATEIDGILYDISGIVEDDEDRYYDFQRYMEDTSQSEIDTIIENCILLKGGEC